MACFATVIVLRTFDNKRSLPAEFPGRLLGSAVLTLVGRAGSAAACVSVPLLCLFAEDGEVLLFVLFRQI